jgi:hypothetical protein
MRWFKLCGHDVKHGIVRNGLFLLTPICVAILCNQCRGLLTLWEQPGDWGVYLAYCFKGMQTIQRATLQQAFQMPVLWLVIMVLPLAITLQYPFRDMDTIGSQMLLRSGSRITWWLCKCGWNGLCTAVYFALIYATIAIFCLCHGVALSLDTPMSSMIVVFSEADITTAVEEMTRGQTVFSLLLMPFLTVAAMNLFEMLLSLLFRPVYGFLFSVALVAASSYVTSPLLIGNYANLSRCGAFIHDGLDGKIGCLICLGVIVFSLAAGAVIFHRRDILPDYKEL